MAKHQVMPVQTYKTVPQLIRAIYAGFRHSRKSHDIVIIGYGRCLPTFLGPADQTVPIQERRILFLQEFDSDPLNVVVRAIPGRQETTGAGWTGSFRKVP